MTNPKVDVQALAQLSRLEISDAERAKLEQEIPAILKFVEQIQGVAADAKQKSPELRNVLRPDENPHESGLYTERILAAAPKSVNGRVVVKQVLSRKENQKNQ